MSNRIVSSKYVQESYLCASLEAALGNPDVDLLQLGYKITVHREAPMAHGLRPDFFCYGKKNGKSLLHFVEVKVAADAFSVWQICNYLYIFRKHAEFANFSKHKLVGHLIARTFDKHVYSLAELAGIKLWRLRLYKKLEDEAAEPFDLAPEAHIFDRSSLDQDFLYEIGAKQKPAEVQLGTN